MDKVNISEKVFEKIEFLFENYKSSLSTYTSDQFNFKAAEDVWSLAEMYEHVCMSAKKFFLANTRRCIEQRNGQLGGEKNAAGENVFKYGGFPPMKFKVPGGPEAANISGRDKSVYFQEIEEILESARQMINPLESDAGEYKTLHPVLGWLNAMEWFQNLEMHSRHHLTQKAELENLAKHG